MILTAVALVEIGSWGDGMIGGWLKFILKVAVFKLVEFSWVHFVISYLEDETAGIV